MGIFGALNSAVSGLRAQSTALENISGNIANSQSTGFKRIDTTFSDLVTGKSAQVSKQTSGMVLAASRSTNTVQGDIQSSSNDTHMAINGDGYFVIQAKSAEVDGRPVFSGVDVYTRRGDFEMDKNGYLVNGAGYYLKGLALDRATGNPVGSLPEVIQFSSDFLQAERTSQVDYRANLARTPLTANYDPAIPNSELLNPALFGTDPRSTTLGGTGTVLGADVAEFLENSISGDALTMYDTNGTPVSVQFRWAKMDSEAAGGADVWNMFYQINSDAGATDVAWQNVGVDYTFVSGQLSPAVPSVALSGLTVDGTLVGDVTINHGMGGMTQYADPNGRAKLTALTQNGSPSGEMIGIQISDNGRVVASYSNGKMVAVAQIPIVSFNADSALKRMDGGAFAVTDQSGPPIFGASGIIIGQALEASNTDIADEFSKLIVTQQAYNANTRIISTSDEMLREILNVVR